MTTLLNILAFFAVLALGCGSDPPPTVADLHHQLTEAEKDADYFGAEVRSVEAQLKTDNARFYIDGGQEEVTRGEAEEALAEARLKVRESEVTIRRLSREIEAAESADLTASQ